MKRRGAVGLLALSLLATGCSTAPAPVAEVQELPAYVVDEPLPAREELVVDVHEVLGDAADLAAERTARVVDALHGEIALEHARSLGAALPVRTAFTVGERDAADWIVTELRAIGVPEDDVHLQTFGTKSLDGHSRAELDTLRQREDLERVELSQNVVARLQGTGDGIIVVGAHYDSVHPDGPGDNGTGVGLLLETAWRLQGQDLPHSVELVFFGAEHAGFAGARAYLASMPPQERDAVVLMVNVTNLADADELGFDAGLLDLETGTPRRDELSEAIAGTATGLDLGLRPFHQGIFAAGANLPFTYAGVRVLQLSSVTEHILERPSLDGGHFSPGRTLSRVTAPEPTGPESTGPESTAPESADGEAGDVAEGMAALGSPAPDDASAPTPTPADALSGRRGRALYVYGTFLEALLLGFPS